VIRPGSPVRVSRAYAVALMPSLSKRDWAIIHNINALSIMTGGQLERLLFPLLTSSRSRSVVRWRTLKRLVDARVLHAFPLPGRRAGSAERCYELDSAGQKLMQISANLAGDGHLHKSDQPGERFVLHTLATSELYVALVERSAPSGVLVERYLVERATTWPMAHNTWLRPDALCVLRHGSIRDYWWVETDRATESLPTIRRKLRTYLAFVESGQLGPDSIVPRVLFTCPTEARCAAIRREIRTLPEPASVMFGVVVDSMAPELLIRELIGT
jgi:hypothetical protein